jgi:hypothetical protein
MCSRVHALRMSAVFCCTVMYCPKVRKYSGVQCFARFLKYKSACVGASHHVSLQGLCDPFVLKVLISKQSKVLLLWLLQALEEHMETFYLEALRKCVEIHTTDALGPMKNP